MSTTLSTCSRAGQKKITRRRTIRLIDGFTTQDGEWFVSNKPYSINPTALTRYGQYANELGGANHIWVKTIPGATVHFNTGDFKNPVTMTANQTGWVNLPLHHSSSYAPGRGEKGPWFVTVNGALIRDGIGLPDGLHVSTFLITSEVDDGPVPVTPPVARDLLAELEAAAHHINTAILIAKGRT